MKKSLLLILIFILIFTLFLSASVTSSAETASPYSIAETYIGLYPARDSLSGGEEAAAVYLSSRLQAMGYVVTTSEHKYTDDSGAEKKEYSYRHVIGGKDNGKGKSVVIGCYYGGYSTDEGKGEGATNALSVGLLLNLAERLYPLSLDYDLTIAFWGGAEVSSDFDVKNCGVDLSKIALYIHLDGVAAGTSDYLYADDVSRSHEKYFREIIASEEAGILAAPAFKKPLSLLSNGAYSYTHAGLVGVNRYFMSEDVPCVDFVGGAWDFDCGLYRYDGDRNDLEGTQRDTLAEIDEKNGGADKTAQRLEAVANVIVKGLTGEDLPAVLDRAAKETSAADLDSRLAYYLITFIGSALLIAFFLFLIFKQGKDRRETVWEQSFTQERQNPTDPFEEFRSEDVRTPPSSPFEELGSDEGKESQAGSERKENADDGDDVFRF